MTVWGQAIVPSLKTAFLSIGVTLQVRPMTHDMLKNTLAAFGARVSIISIPAVCFPWPENRDMCRRNHSVHGESQVTKVCVTALINNTYHAQVHYSREGSTDDLVVDSRPSDALNLAVRFGAPVYVNKVVADKMASPLHSFERKSEAPSEIVKSCKDALKRYHDPTVVHKINLEIAIAENRFEDATQ